MSIINRLTAGHLDDAALAEIWTAGAAGSTEVIPGVIDEPHLAECAECRVRFAAFVSWMATIRADARTEADEVFPAERLTQQQAQILRRLEAAERPARVIAFPTHTGAEYAPSRVHRWVGMAAAAGLIIGLGLGNLIDIRHFGETPRTAETATAPAKAVVPASATFEEGLLDDFNTRPATPRYEAVRAIDTMTPRAADYVTSSR